jgi:predicted Zn-dependent peptidase
METLGISSNARTGTDIIRYYMWGSIGNYQPILEFLLEQLVHPLFGQKQIGEQKEVVRQELSRLIDDDPEKLTNQFMTLLYPDRPQFAQDRIDTLANVTRSDIVDYYTATHTCKNTWFVIAGDMSSMRADNIIKILNEYLVDYREGKKLQYRNAIYPKFAGQLISLNSPSETNQHFDVAFISQPHKAPWQQAAAMRIVSCLYNYGSGSRIFQKARSQGLSYDVRSGFSLDKNIFSEFYIIDQTSPKELLKLIELCLRELRNIVDGKFSSAELKRAKGMLYGDYSTGYETPYELADWYGPEFVDDDKLMSPQQYAYMIADTTKKQIVDTAKEFIRSDNWAVSLVGKNADKHRSAVGKLVLKYFG